jgi:hypothetical protein
LMTWWAMGLGMCLCMRLGMGFGWQRKGRRPAPPAHLQRLDVDEDAAARGVLALVVVL